MVILSFQLSIILVNPCWFSPTIFAVSAAFIFLYCTPDVGALKTCQIKYCFVVYYVLCIDVGLLSAQFTNLATAVEGEYKGKWCSLYRKLCCTACLKKNIPDIFSCNSRKHFRIFIMFGTRVTEKVSIRRCYSFPPHLTMLLHYLR